MRELAVKVASNGGIGINDSGNCRRNPMSPQARWPLMQISVSGIAPELWDAFRDMNEKMGITVRSAIEEAVSALSKEVSEGQSVVWPHPKAGRSHTVQMHESVHVEIQRMARELGYKQNIIIIAAIDRWMAAKIRQ
jgi:hypothetical protein